MLKYTKTKTRLLTLILLVSILIPSTTTLHMANAAETTTDLKINLTFQANNGTIINSTQQPTFAPFDLIQLTANLTNGNQTIPESTVVFSVKGPSSASYQTEIVRTAETDTAGSANITFRIPLEGIEKIVIGKWQVHANVETTNGTLQKTASFQVAWPIQNLAIDFYDAQGHSQSVFNRNDTVRAVIGFNSNQSQTQSINFIVQDTSGHVLTHQAQDISANATGKNEVTYDFKIPDNAPFGLASANLNIYGETYENVSIPAAQNKIAYFSIGNYTAPPDQTSPTATPTPSPAPTPLENTLSLFSWLLVAIGFFTFTILVVFLKRKPFPKMGTTSLPPAMPIQTTDITPGPIQQPPVPSEKSLKDSLIQIQALAGQSMQSSEDTSKESKSHFASQQEATVAHLSNIAATAKKIQELQAALKIEKEQLNREISGLNQTIDEQENIIKSYYDTLRNEVKKAQQLINDDKSVTEAEENKKQDGDNN
ncbi:MAG: hypothetical protein ACQCN6_00245 [Candidatus Bathyarchaeia archaeon]|jgi:hypothetical protein